MTIRVTCDQCGSVLKIKDELAGTDGKCPKCKTRFVVPPLNVEQPVEELEVDAPEALPERLDVPSPLGVPVASVPVEPAHPAKTPAKPAAKPAEKVAEKPAVKATEKPAVKATEKPGKKPAEDEEFDPVSFLMDGPKKKPTLDPEPEPASRQAPAGSPSRNGGGGGGGFSLDDDESSPDQETGKPVAATRKWGAKKEGSAAAAADSSLGGSKNAAKDLLAKSMEESRVRASEMPEEAPRFNFDMAGFIREIGVKGIGSVVGVIVAGLGLWWVMNNMMVNKVKLPPLGYMSGTVTVKGKPAAGVMVSLTPIELAVEGAKRKETARTSLGITDAEGHFTLYYLPEIEGVKVGSCRLSMESSDPAVLIPDDYGARSRHMIEVKRGTNPPQKFEL